VFVGPGFWLASGAVGEGVGAGVVGWVAGTVGVGASDGVGIGASGADVSGAEVSGAGESDTDVDGAAGCVAGELADAESDAEFDAESDGGASGSEESDDDAGSDGESSVGADVGSGTGLGVGSGSGVGNPTIAERVVLGDVSGVAPFVDDPADGVGDVDPGGNVTGYVTKLAVGCPLSSAGSTASAPPAPRNVPSA
jgi:hypothetical protein